jgi:hypothetical protein
MKNTTKNELILARRKRQKNKKIAMLGLILALGLVIINHKSLFATNEEMIGSAEVMSRYIIAEYQREGKDADLEKICRTAKRLDDYGLKLIVNEDGAEKTISFVKDMDPSPLNVKTLVVAIK